MQVQGYVQHAVTSQAKILAALAEDPAAQISGDSDFPPHVVSDAMEFAAFLTASISRMTLYTQVEVRLDRRARIIQHLPHDQGKQTIPAFARKRLLELPLNTKFIFGGEFSSVLKDTTNTEAVAFQASRIAAGNAPQDLSQFRIPKKAPSKTVQASRRGKFPSQANRSPQSSDQDTGSRGSGQGRGGGGNRDFKKPGNYQSNYSSRGRGRGRGGPARQ